MRSRGSWRNRRGLDTLYAAPGNPGIARMRRCVALDATDHAAVVDFVRGA